MNKRKILEAARKLAQKGAKDKALVEYQKLLKLDPKDAKLRLEIGDAHRRWGQVDQAVETYTRVAEQYMAEGFDARAVAVFKQILNLASDRFEAYAPLAELYERMGLAAEAISALQTAADGYHRQGKKSEALDLLRKMANADPSNTRSRIKVADLLRQEGKKEDAVSEYQLAAEELERQGDAEAVGGVYRRILELDETNVRALGTLAQNLAVRGKIAEAIPLAERALQLDDGNAERYDQLATLFERAKRAPDRERVLRRLADLYRNRGDEDRAREIVQRFALSDLSAADPDADRPDELASGGLLEDDPDALFGDEFPDSDGAPELSIDFGSDMDIDPGSSRSGATMQPLRDSLGATQTGKRAGAASSGLVGANAAELPLVEVAVAKPPSAVDLEQLLAEASVYLRYGKRDKAIAHLQRVIDADPEHRGALDKLGEAYAESGEHEQAVEVWMRAAKRAHDDGDGDALRVLRGRIAVLDESAAASIASALREASPPPVAQDDDAADLDADYPLDAGHDSGDLVLDDDDDELLDDLSLPEVERAAEPERGPAASAPAIDRDVVQAKKKAGPGSTDYGDLSASAKQQVLDDLEEADFYMQQGLHDEAERIYQRVLSVAPNHPRALLRLGEIAAARGDAPGRQISIADADETPVPDIDLDEEEGAFSAPDDDASEPDDDDEVEIPVEFSDEGIDDPEPLARSAGIEDLSDLDLDDADADSGDANGDGSDTQEIRPGVDAPGGAVTAPIAAARPGDSDGGFDLAAALSDAFDDEPAGSSGSAARPGDDGFAAVFQAFKKGVRETLSEGDHQAHYDLAIAYKEMGLLDDAIHELRTAMADPGRTAECLHLIGLCAIDADQAPLAIEHLEQLLTLPNLDPDAVLAGRFDLGRALESVGDLDGARREWEAVAAVKPRFQDVGRRLAGLGEPKPEPSDGGFESFDDVMNDAADEEADEVVVGGETFDDLVAEANVDESDPLEAEMIVEAQPIDEEPEPEPTRPKPAPPAPRRKKKISFL